MRNLSLLVVTLVLASSAAAQEKPPKTPLLQDGVLQQLHVQLEQVFQFTLDGPRLKLDRKRWSDPPKVAIKPVFENARAGPSPPIEQVFNQMGRIAGFDGSSMNASGRYRELRYTGTALNGRVLTRDDTVRLDLEETQQRSLEFQDDGQGGLRLMLSHPRGDVILLLQTKEGACTVAAVIGGKSFAAHAPSFVALYKQHRQAFDAEILPVFNALSIRLLVVPSSPEVKAAARAMLLRSPRALEEGRKLIADLDNDRFIIRDEATRLLNERFESYKDLIEAKLKAKGLTIEADRRLQKILAAHAGSEKIGQVIAALELLKDAPFLIDLLEETPVGQRAPIITRLEEVTGRRLGNDVAAWKRWLDEKK